MAKWNYRVIKSGKDTETYFTIQEVHYEEEDSKEYSHTIDCTPGGNSVDEIKTQLERMLKCLDKPSLDEIPKEEGEEINPDETIYYESHDGGKTLQAIDLDEMLDQEEEGLAAIPNSAIDEIALKAEKKAEEDWEEQNKQFENLDKAVTEETKPVTEETKPKE